MQEASRLHVFGAEPLLLAVDDNVVVRGSVAAVVLRRLLTFAQHEPLTDDQLDRLGDFLESCKGGRA